MSYVSLRHSEPFLKCLEVIAQNNPCTIDNSVLYFPGKPGKGFITVAGILPGIELLVVNIPLLSSDLGFEFLPSGPADRSISEDNNYWILCFGEIGLATDEESALSVDSMGVVRDSLSGSSVSISDSALVRQILFPKGREVRSLIVRIRKSGLRQLIHDWDIKRLSSLFDPAQKDGLSWPITFRYRLLLGDFMEEILSHPFRELFALKNISILLEYLLQQFLVMDKLLQEGQSLSNQDITGLSKVEEYLCRNYRTEFPGISRLSRISAMSPTSLKTKFKKYYGETLFSYYQKNKLEQARKLLDGRVPVKVVATEIGYSNPSHFTLAFKKEYGFSPWHYLNPQ